jgi:dihydrofolate reductase
MAEPTISMIAAMAEDRAIGKGKGMLWHLPDDFRHFKRTTTGHPVIMGRKTFESLGGALPNRLNIVITRRPDYQPEGAEVVNSLQEALHLAQAHDEEEIFIAGGGEIYEQGMELTDKLYLTIVHGHFPEADTFFPPIDWQQWHEVKREQHSADEQHKFAFTFLFLERKK